MRCFLALDLPEVLRDEVSDLQMHLIVRRTFLGDQGPPLPWVHPSVVFDIDTFWKFDTW